MVRFERATLSWLMLTRRCLIVVFYRKMKIGCNSLEKRQKRSSLDRRTGEDRRRVYHIGFIEIVGAERRVRVRERREMVEEKRAGWVRVNSWSSVCINSKGLYY
ncbi:hypothetical protein HRM2_35430 [Desulforapulum autotrophicum HRM2]|uniref:Uncharacterized protein n=2 Tax=Desulforapulum autotrophicum TaxID=2296 RepID=C0Q9A3_DESAH|nr:hypothetical protein HRM2_35430 [Desulforapulum autotrophicum HRM2]